MSDKCYDKLDREITVGSFIIYGTLLGRCAALRVGRVEEVRKVKKEWQKDEDAKWHITVTGVNERFSWKDQCVKCELGKKGTLQFPDRCVVIDKSDLATKYRVLFQ